MKNIIMLCSVASFSILLGCASNKPFNKEQLAIINQNKIVVKKLPAEKNKPLHIYSRSGKVGAEVAKVALGLLLGSYSSQSSGDTPRTRFESSSLPQAITESGRKASGEKIVLETPTQIIGEILSKKFEVVDENSINKDDLTIKVQTVAWHLYYSKMISQQKTYLLEYAADVNLSSPNAKLARNFYCDKQSKQALTKEDWLANDKLRIRTFTHEIAEKCFKQILSELGQH